MSRTTLRRRILMRHSSMVLVNLHCHSVFSDGDQTPESLAANLAVMGVRSAALTDHDSVDGLPRFREAARKRGIAFIPGVEITAQFHGREIHVLGYGFDPDSQELITTLQSLRQTRNLEVHSIAESLRNKGTSRHFEGDSEPAEVMAPDGRLDIIDAIALLHRSGGKAFLAHPLLFEADMITLDQYLGDLKQKGLDGLEVIYPSFSEVEQLKLRQLAEKYDLILCAGTDFHGANGIGGSAYGIEMEWDDWNRYRQAIFLGSGLNGEKSTVIDSLSKDIPTQQPTHGRARRFRRRYFVLRILIPTLIAILLFLTAIWGYILPSFERTLLERKREIIRELTNSAWSILASYEQDVGLGRISRSDAQALAIDRIKSLRYGEEGKDYFWLQDMYPRMIMHPYRSDLDGQDLTGFVDSRGAAIFVEFADLVRRRKEGYINYVWQWKDDPLRLEPKESYVKGFDPWGWIIGTGIYTDDVYAEIAQIERGLIVSSSIISSVVVLLLLFAAQQSLRIEKERQEVEDDLRESTQRYYSLIEATTEGTLLILDGCCSYANPTFLEMSGYSAQQMEFLDIQDLLPTSADNSAIWQRIRQVNHKPENANGDGLEGSIQHADGHRVECVFVLNPIQVSGQLGFILLARDVTRHPKLILDEGLAQAAQNLPVGVFLARAARRCPFLARNLAANALMEHIRFADGEHPGLADLFFDEAEFDGFMHILLNDRKIRDYILRVSTTDATLRFLMLSANLVSDGYDQPAAIAGEIRDITQFRKRELGREALVEKLQSSLLFLHETIESLGDEAVICEINSSIGYLARQMTLKKTTAALIVSETGDVIGIITDHDLRARALADNLSTDTPIYTIMSSPLIKISKKALIYEALMRMEERGVRHLAVEDDEGRVRGIVDDKALLQFQRYGAIILSRDISRAENLTEVVQSSERIPSLVKSLVDSGARPRRITHMLTSVCDASTERLIELAFKELGPPPAPFTFIAMGSQGREEQTLVSDQDNGIIYVSEPGANTAEVENYFLQLGRQVCAGLDQVGYPLCRGQVMANNPRWCRSLPEWKEGFQSWIDKSEDQEIINTSIFFDFRTVYGDAGLAHELRYFIHHVIQQDPAFLQHFARNTLQFKPPLRLPGNIYLSGGATEHAGEVNLKDAMMPMVSFARLYALRHQVNQTHTLERVEALCERNVIMASSRDEFIASYGFLMQIRLRNQIDLIQSGKTPNNIINPGKLGYMQQELLKQAFSQIVAVQKKIGFDFYGMS